MRKVICAAVAVALCWPLAAGCRNDLMGVGFQFSVTDPQGPDRLTDIAESGLHFRTFYRAITFNDKWNIVGEFGYNDFRLRESEFANMIKPVLADSLGDLFPLGPSLPAGSEVTIDELTVSGGHLNAMHVTGGIQYLFPSAEDALLRPYLTAQGGFYSTGQSDADVAVTLTVDRPGSMPDTTISFPSGPFIRDGDRDNAFGLNFGGGTEISLTRSVALLADARYHVAFTEDKRTTFFDLGLGLVYFLGL